MKKIHISESLILIIYLIVLVVWFSFNRSVDLFNGDSLNDKVFGYSLIALILFSNWSILRLKRVSIVLWPFYILLGLYAGQLGGDVPSWSTDNIAPLGVFVRARISIGILALQLFSCLIFARKDFLKILTVSLLSFMFIFVLDLIFINHKEMDAKGDYSSWRIHDFGTSYVNEVDEKAQETGNCTNSQWEYFEAETGFSFCYDPSWGDPTLREDQTGSSISFTNFLNIDYRPLQEDEVEPSGSVWGFCFSCIDFNKTERELHEMLFYHYSYGDSYPADINSDSNIVVEKKEVLGKSALYVEIYSIADSLNGVVSSWYFIPSAFASYDMSLQFHPQGREQTEEFIKDLKF